MIKPGTILIEKGTALPASVRLETTSYPGAWMSITGSPNAVALESELAETGWTSFYMASEIRTTAFGFNREASTFAALQRLITIVQRQNCNCLQIDAVAEHNFLGMPYMSVTGHSRHIQAGQMFSGA